MKENNDLKPSPSVAILIVERLPESPLRENSMSESLSQFMAVLNDVLTISTTVMEPCVGFIR